MKTIVYRAGLLMAGCALLAACSSATPPEHGTATAATQLFTLEPTPDRSTLQKNATGYLATLLADPANQEVTLVNIDPAVVSDKTQDLAVTLPNGKTAQFHLGDYNTITPGIDGWVGYKPSAYKQAHPSATSEIDNDPLYDLSLARDGEVIVGSMTIEGQPYRIDYLSPGQYVLLKIDESKLPVEGVPIESPGVAAQGDTKTGGPLTAHSTIRVLFVSTNQSRAANANYRATLAEVLNNANRFMKNSGIAITYELAAYYDADYDQTDRTYWQQATDLRANPKVSLVREKASADMVSIYSTKKELCGQAYLNANKTTAYSIFSCTGSFAHELGHNLGAMHNWPEDGNRNPPYMFGHRQTSSLPKFHTQMSYGCGSNCPRIAYHSNPRLTYEGIPLGTVEHHDASRRFNERRTVVENFYPPFKGIALTAYEQTNFQGRSCLVGIPSGNAANVSSECANQPVRSFRVNGYEAGAKICLYDGTGARHVCYAGDTNAKRDFEVGNIDQSQTVPPEFRRTQKGGVLNGAVVDALYGRNAVLLFAEADFKKPLCSFGLNYKEYVVAEQPGCPTDAGGKARSARIFSDDTEGTAHSQWCFFNGNKSRTLCFTGRYSGKFGVANFDSTRGIPSELKRTQTGGYMNGNVYRFKYDILGSQ